MRNLCLFLAAAVVSFSAAAAPLFVLEKGKASGMVIVPGKHITEKFAAEELQLFLQRFSGVKVPISAKRGKKNIYVGKEFAGSFTADLKALKGTDGFAIRNKKGDMYIFSDRPRATLYGVYAFLERNSDLIFARGNDKMGTIYTPGKRFAPEKYNWRDIPVFKVRGWWICGTQRHADTELWNARMRCNFAPARITPLQQLRRAQKLDFWIRGVGAHNVHRFMPKSYFKTHPEYFSEIDGARREDVYHNQLCYGNLEGAKVFAGELEKYLRGQLKEFNFEVAQIIISDNWRSCECKKCKTEPIKLPGNKIIPATAESYRSTQYYLYLNLITDHITKAFPEMDMFTSAYNFTAPPPDIKLHPRLWLAFCPYVKNDKYSILDPQNKKWKDRIDQWSKYCSRIIWREYWGDAATFPRPHAEMAVRDLQYISKELGVAGVYAEYFPDQDTAKRKYSRFWDASAMEFWVLSRLQWNPFQDVAKLRDEYICRTYRKAAAPMARYWKIIRDAWYSDPAGSVWNDNEFKSAAHYIYGKKLIAPCRAALIEAEKLAAGELPQVQEIVKRHRKQFEEWVKLAPTFLKPEIVVPYSKDAAKAFDFNSAEWKKATVIPALSLLDFPRKKPSQHTEVRLIHDRKNLYIRMDCYTTKADKLYAQKYRKAEVWPRGDHVEIFFNGGLGVNGYYHFAVDCHGNMYDAMNFDNSFNSGWRAIAKRSGKGYVTISALPLDKLGVELSQNNRLAGMFHRGILQDKKHAEDCTWNGGTVHQHASFGDIVLSME